MPIKSFIHDCGLTQAAKFSFQENTNGNAKKVVSKMYTILLTQ